MGELNLFHKKNLIIYSINHLTRISHKTVRVGLQICFNYSQISCEPTPTTSGLRFHKFGEKLGLIKYYQDNQKKRQKIGSLPLSNITLIASIFTSIAATTNPVKAAEEVIITSPVGEFSLPVKSLETFAREGRQDGDFAYYARFISKEELPKLREILQQKVPVTPQQMSQFFYSSMGKMGLEYIGTYVRTESSLNGFYATRAALILAATEPGGISVTGFLRKFPSRTIRIDGNAVFKIFGSVSDLFAATEKASKFIASQSIETTTNPLVLKGIDLRQPGRIRWQKQTKLLTDSKRFLRPQEPRRFNVDVYLPQIPQPAPLIIISHGFGSDRTDFVYLAEHLASYGFAVAVLDHPGSSNQRLQAFLRGEVNDASEAREFIDRPLDITFLIDELTKLNQSEFVGKIDFKSIGVIGHSFGGYTTLAVAGAELNLPMLRQECRVGNFNLNDGNTSYLLQCLARTLPRSTPTNFADKRVKSIFVINPIGAGIFGENGINKIQVPTVFAASSHDVVAPAILEQICPYTWLKTPEKTFMYTQNGSHIDANQNTGSSPIPLESNIASANPKLARNYYQALTLAFAQTYVAKKNEYAQYLQPQYAAQISQQPLPLFILKNLTQEQVDKQIGVQCLN